MKKEIYEFILALIVDQKNDLIATRLYLEHQISLDRKFRVCQDDEVLMEENIIALKLQTLAHEQAEDEFVIKFRPDTPVDNY